MKKIRDSIKENFIKNTFLLKQIDLNLKDYFFPSRILSENIFQLLFFNLFKIQINKPYYMLYPH